MDTNSLADDDICLSVSVGELSDVLISLSLSDYDRGLRDLLAKQLQKNNSKLTSLLQKTALHGLEDDERILCLLVFSSALERKGDNLLLEGIVFKIIIEFLSSSSEILQWHAVAEASALREILRYGLRKRIQETANASMDRSLRNALMAFLRANK